MKKLLLLTAIVGCTVSALAQGKSQKKEQVKTVHTKQQNSRNTHHNTHTTVVANTGHEGVRQSSQHTGVKYSKNLPTNVNSSFTRDYPNATNVTWTKSQGNWTATFPNGYYRTSVTYAANGHRTNTTRRRLRL